MLDGAGDDSDASEPEDEPEASEGGMSDDELEPAPASAATRPPPKRSRSGKRRPESRRQSRVRAGSSQLSPGQKMQRMRLWFEQNDGIPPRGDKSAGFDMGMFWNSCCLGKNQDLFDAALSESSEMKAARVERRRRRQSRRSAAG